MKCETYFVERGHERLRDLGRVNAFLQERLAGVQKGARNHAHRRGAVASLNVCRRARFVRGTRRQSIDQFANKSHK